MKALRSLLIASLLAVASTAAAQDANPWKFEFHGFTVGSLYMQDQVFLTGQGSGLLLAAAAPANNLPRPGNATDKSGTFLGGDVRQTRFIFNMSGPDAFGAKAKMHLELDLFGPPNPGALGYESATPRLRQTYAELKWGNTTLDVGQHSAHILLAQIPASVAHITNPVTFGAGLLGWRTIGLRAFHALPMDSWKLELGVEVAHGKWNDLASTTAGVFPNAAPGNSPAQISLAWASNTPNLVGRVKADGKSGNLSWMGWVAGSYESINLKGFGNSVAPTGVTLQGGEVKSSITSYAATGGVNITFQPVVLMAQAYTGRATAPVAGSMLQFGDIADMGYWAQLGVFATKQISFWGIYGGSSSNKNDLQKWGNLTGAALTAANTGLRAENAMYGGMIRFMDNGYAFAAEYYANKTKYLLGNLAAPGGTVSTDVYQLIVSGGYFF